jgi:hypothetical protein
MKLHFGFTNGTPPVDVDVNVLETTPIELVIAPHGDKDSRRNALSAYLRTLDYMFRGVSNMVAGAIGTVSIEKSWFGKMEKRVHVIDWTAVVDRTFVVIYDLSLKSITEHMYVADAISVDGKKSNNEVNPVWIKELLSPSFKDEETMRKHNIRAVELVTTYIKDYRLVYGRGGYNGLTILSPKGKAITVEEIADDEAFILVRLLTLLVGKGLHWSVFMIDCANFSNSIIEAFLLISELFFGDAYVFLYNCKSSLELERIKVVLPNFYLTKSS